LEIIEGVKEAISRLRSVGFEIVVVTNQPDVSRGYVTPEFIGKLHNKIKQETGIHHFYTCMHDDLEKCSCRKPKPGLLRQASVDLHLNLAESIMIGDRWKDMEAGQLAGCRCFFIEYDYLEARPKPPFEIVKSLLEAATRITEESSARIIK
jgi:D-glycero-D-manno-heptose 1,7-bisphosphate phosphatase